MLLINTLIRVYTSSTIQTFWFSCTWNGSQIYKNIHRAIRVFLLLTLFREASLIAKHCQATWHLNSLWCILLPHHIFFLPTATNEMRVLMAARCFPAVSECLQSQGGDLILDPSLPNGSLRNSLPLPPLGLLPPCPPIAPQAKSRVFAIILYAEFLKELAAIAQEHSIALDRCAEE